MPNILHKGHIDLPFKKGSSLVLFVKKNTITLQFEGNR